MHSQGLISDAELKACIIECCIEECLAQGYSADECRYRICGSTPQPPPPPSVLPPGTIPPPTRTPPFFQARPVEPDCEDACALNYPVGSPQWQLCMRDCAPPTRPPAAVDPTCEQSCMGRYGVMTQAFFDCVARECTLTSAPGPKPPFVPAYIPMQVTARPVPQPSGRPVPQPSAGPTYIPQPMSIRRAPTPTSLQGIR